MPDGIEPFLKFIKYRRDKYPNARNEVKRVIAEGDLVALHVHSVVIPGSPAGRSSTFSASRTARWSNTGT